MAGFGVSPMQETTAQMQVRFGLQQRMKNGASWFYWIAALSAINTGVVLSGSNWHFLAGLGITDVITYIAQKAGNLGMIVAIMMNALALGVFVLFGVFAGKKQLWAFVVGMTFYGLDALIYLLGQEWISIAFHAFVLFQVFKGMQAARQLSQLEEQLPHTIAATS